MIEEAEVEDRYTVLRRQGRIMTLGIGISRLGDIVLGRIGVSVPDLPADAIHVNTALDFMRDCVTLTFAHESFAPVEPGTMAPMADFGTQFHTLGQAA